jgi:hypothetical protein
VTSTPPQYGQRKTVGLRTIHGASVSEDARIFQRSDLRQYGHDVSIAEG